jgi:hypothetical protein
MLTFRVLKNSAELRPAELPRELRQPSANSAEDAACRLPCPYTLRQVAFCGFANRHTGVPGAQHGQLVSIGKLHGGTFRRRFRSQARFHRCQFGTIIALL